MQSVKKISRASSFLNIRVWAGASMWSIGVSVVPAQTLPVESALQSSVLPGTIAGPDGKIRPVPSVAVIPVVIPNTTVSPDGRYRPAPTISSKTELKGAPSLVQGPDGQARPFPSAAQLTPNSVPALVGGADGRARPIPASVPIVSPNLAPPIPR